MPRLNPPLHTCNPEDWWVYYDQCLDQKCLQEYCDLIWKIAAGLELHPKLYLYKYPQQGGPFYETTNPLWPNDCYAWKKEGDKPTTPPEVDRLIEYQPRLAWEFYLLVAIL